MKFTTFSDVLKSTRILEYSSNDDGMRNTSWKDGRKVNIALIMQFFFYLVVLMPRSWMWGC